jgi:hypothetical protein
MMTNMHRVTFQSTDNLEPADIELLGVAAICLLFIGLVAVFATGGVLA